MFSKSFVFAVVAFVAFVSLGALLLPRVGEAQCVWGSDTDPCDLGSDPLNNPWGNSPGPVDIGYCIDRDCVLNLNLFPFPPIPTPQVTQIVSSNNCSDPTRTVTISGNIVAFLRDASGIIPGSAVPSASLFIQILGVTCSPDPLDGTKTILSRVLTLDSHVPAGDPRTDVFANTSKITIPNPPAEWQNAGCAPSAPCSFPLGIVEFQNKNELSTELPATAAFLAAEVYRAVESTRFIGVRDCKGDAGGNEFTIACSVGEIVTGGNSVALFTFDGDWAGATNHTFNPKSGTNPYDIDISTQPSAIIEPGTVSASANNGPQVPTTGCNNMPSHQTVRCSFSASALLPQGCSNGQAVAVQVTGKLLLEGAEFKFVSRDFPTCSNKK